MAPAHAKVASFARADPAPRRVCARLLRAAQARGPVIVTARAIRAARVTRVDRVSARRFHVHVRVAIEKEVDGQLREWLREAYDLRA